MLPDGSLVNWESPEGTDLEIAAAAPEIPWTDLAYSLVPNGGTLDYIADAPYFGHVDKIGIEKKTWVHQLYLGGLLAGFYAPAGEDPDADLTTWKSAPGHRRSLRGGRAGNGRGDHGSPLLVLHR